MKMTLGVRGIDLDCASRVKLRFLVQESALLRIAVVRSDVHRRA
jgi:hypothetical protein